MNKLTPTFLLLLIIAIPSALNAQGFALGARAGTLGFGGEVALSLSDNLAVRGGLGSFFYEYEDELEGVDYTISPPSMTATVGIDVYPWGGSFRLIGGIMFRDGDFEAESGDLSQVGSIDIGDETFDDVDGRLFGTLATNSTAPFVGMGFGNHTQGGFGFFIDFGVAFVGEPDVDLRAEGPVTSNQLFMSELAKEEQAIQDDAGGYLTYWPILNLGVKIPFK